jgi:thioredoxin-like negative regulator of GroEL
LPPISLPAAASASGPAKTSYAFDQVLVWENEVMAKALSESSEKDDVVLMLQECFARLKMTAKANDKANLALEKINAGVSGMEALIKVFQRLQDAQEISQTVIGRGANETFDL